MACRRGASLGSSTTRRAAGHLVHGHDFRLGVGCADYDHTKMNQGMMKTCDRGFLAPHAGRRACAYTAVLFMRAPRTQRPPALDRQNCASARISLRRVGVPKMIASASAGCSTRATGICANSARACFAPLFSSISSGQVRELGKCLPQRPALPLRLRRSLRPIDARVRYEPDETGFADLTSF